MHTLISTDLSELAAQRRAVVFAVSRQVPGADPELATSFGLEQLCREIAVHGTVDHPVDYWHNAAIDAATGASTAEPAVGEQADATTTAVVHDESGSPGPARPGASGAARPELPPSIEPAGRATGSPATARRRPRASANMPAPGFASVTAEPPACRVTRGAMHDYIRHRLLPSRRRELEDHLVSCAACVRAFTDVRESYWIQQAQPPMFRLGMVSVPDGLPVTPAVAR
ncbi:zf-HC2 domain-containing protein [Myceligenerans xiligouense]|uniref:Putative zinc finger protein n=1 Tax=Myceligenerans xiligouense TaxID=253184 RepID=A0A3N4YT31_9MICO|nr:zf-HC2 domain-containing protein [Myceligenerans xiligouense]RPF23357.1 putative zinc finger protein [Myceligenerans xiligouense]